MSDYGRWRERAVDRFELYWGSSRNRRAVLLDAWMASRGISIDAPGVNIKESIDAFVAWLMTWAGKRSMSQELDERTAALNAWMASRSNEAPED